MLGRILLLLPLLTGNVLGACSDYYTPLVCSQSNPTLLQTTESATYSCVYDQMSGAGTPPVVPLCQMTCPTGSQMIAYLPEFGSQMYLLSASFDSTKWTGVQPPPAANFDMGATVQFGCLGSPRCGPYIDDKGIQSQTRCHVTDKTAICNEDLTLPLCTCTAGMTGTNCDLPIVWVDKIVAWLGKPLADKLLEIIRISQRTPTTLLEILPLLMSFLTELQRRDMSWSLDEIVDSIDYELKEVDYKFAFKQVVDDRLGNCYTFNYANLSNHFDGLYHTRFSGQSRDFSIMVKLDPAEQLAFIENAAITTYIHAPGTPPTQGVVYSLKAGASDVVGLQKAITHLIANCITSIGQLKQNYYEDGDYTREGCYMACYQDKVLEKCGCMDARFRGAASAGRCQFKDNDCINSVTAELGEPSSWPACKCPKECYSEVYTVASSRSVMPYKIPTCTNTNETEGCPELNEKIARLSIYLESLESEVYVEMAQMTILSFFSQLGAQMGFLLGMSIVGVLELIILCATLGKDVVTYKKKQ